MILVELTVFLLVTEGLECTVSSYTDIWYTGTYSIVLMYLEIQCCFDVHGEWYWSNSSTVTYTELSSGWEKKVKVYAGHLADFISAAHWSEIYLKMYVYKIICIIKFFLCTHVQAAFLCQGCVPVVMLHKFYTEFPFKTVYFLGVQCLTTSSCIVSDFTTGRHMDL